MRARVGKRFLVLCVMGGVLIGSASAFAQSAAQVPLNASASVSGIVQDESGAPISGVDVTLTRSGESEERSTSTGADGRFAFHDLLPGRYVVTAHAAGFQRFTSSAIVLAEHEGYQLPTITLPIATVTTEVVVRPTEVIADRSEE